MRRADLQTIDQRIACRALSTAEHRLVARGDRRPTPGSPGEGSRIGLAVGAEVT